MGIILDLLIYLLILGILWYLVEYVIRTLPVPDPPASLIRIVLVVLFCLILIGLLLGLTGAGGFKIPRLTG